MQPQGFRGYIVGPLLFTTCVQPEGAPRIDRGTTTTFEGEQYEAVIFRYRGERALVLGLHRRPARVLGFPLRCWRRLIAPWRNAPPVGGEGKLDPELRPVVKFEPHEPDE